MNDPERNRRDNYEALGRELMRVEAENAKMRAALRECITDDGSHALAYDYDGGKADRRLRAINDIARAALGQDGAK